MWYYPPVNKREHWENVYQTKRETDVSWYQPHLERSLDLILRTGVGTDAHIIDVGGGASTLVDDLLARGFRNITVVDIAAEPLEVAKKRLGTHASDVEWRVGDITSMEFESESFDVWHDRAVFHFLTSEADRKRYLERVCFALKRGGFVVLATFGPKGPEKCSGLPVKRYGADQLHGIFGSAFRLVAHAEETHRTPWGSEQEFVYCLCMRDGVC